MIGASELAEIENEVVQLQHSIDTTQEVLQFNLARSRNRLQTLNLFTSIGALYRLQSIIVVATNSLFERWLCGVAGAFSMGTGAFGAGLFGMNMECEQFFGPESEGLFWPVTATLSGARMLCEMSVVCTSHKIMS